ncbi:MAG: hypothetical protein AAGN66_11295 [Acidobacteriota bacterium]
MSTLRAPSSTTLPSDVGRSLGAWVKGMVAGDAGLLEDLDRALPEPWSGLGTSGVTAIQDAPHPTRIALGDLARLRAAHRGEGSLEDGWFRPAHYHALLQTAVDSSNFPRLVVEAARCWSLRGLPGAATLAAAAVEVVESLDPGDFGADRRRRLLALALAHRADDLRAGGQHLEAERMLASAKAHLRDGAADDGGGAGEIAAAVLEVEAAAARWAGHAARSEELLESALRRVDDGSIPGRREELYLALAIGRFDPEGLGEAVQWLRRAHRGLVSTPFGWLRHEVLHRLVIAEVNLGNTESARPLFHRAAELQRFASPAQRVEQQWMAGRCASIESRAAAGDRRPQLVEEAEALLRRSVEDLQQLGYWRDGLEALGDLLDLYVEEDRQEAEAEEIRRAFLELMRCPEAQRRSAAWIAQVAEDLRRRGLPLEPEAELMAAVEDARRSVTVH